jgi:hypothetical protein
VAGGVRFGFEGEVGVGFSIGGGLLSVAVGVTGVAGVSVGVSGVSVGVSGVSVGVLASVEFNK